VQNVTEELRTALIDRYVIESELGEGGMATVYLAHDTKHNRKVALKVMKPELAAMIGAERFLKEIEVTANLQHPHILPLHDSGEAQGFLYYVMPFVEGETLRAKLDREKQFAIDDAVELTRAISAALDYAHRQGVIHRDIKPENILLVEGQPQVADFGIALAVSQAGGTRLTETGLSIGTPQYMSPEQAMGDRELDARSDVYSVGAMLYEMLTGDPPYMGSTAQAIVAKVITEHAPSVSAARDTVPAHIAASVDKALAKLPADRFTTAAQFAEALVTPGFSDYTTPASIPGAASPRPNRALPVAVAAAVLATALAGWGWLRPRPSSPVQVSRLAVAFPADQALQRTAVGYRFALSPDGTSLAYVGPGDPQPMLWLRRFDQLNASPLPGTEGGFNPSFSPDGSAILFIVEQPRRLKLASLASGSVVTVADSGLGSSGAAWGDDGYLYMDVDEGGLVRMPEGGGAFEPVAMLARDSGEVGVAWPVFIPGGRGLLYRMRYSGSAPTEWNIKATSLASGESKIVTRGVRAQYVDPGYLIYATGEGRLMAAPFDADRLELAGQPTAILEGLGVGVYGVTDFSVADNGTLVYLADGGSDSRSEVLVINRDGTARPFVDEWRPTEFVYAVRPDASGNRVVLMMQRAGSPDDADIFVKTADAGLPVRLTFDGPFNWSPRWSPDGKWVYFLSDRNDTFGVYRKRADGSGRMEHVDTPPLIPSGNLAVAMSDGQLWLVLSVEGTTDEVDVVGFRPGVDTAFVPLLVGPEYHSRAEVSPDGRWIAFNEGDADDRVVVRPFPDMQSGQWQVSEAFGRGPRWSPDGTTIFYRDASGDLVAADVQTEPVFAIVGRRPALGESPAFWTLGAAFAPLSKDEIMVIGAQGGGHETGQLVVVQGFTEELKER
jgi:Tol biopolymer transport system component/tRNA A-37 threonylcarbamoyl transferase component Bud32